MTDHNSQPMADIGVTGLATMGRNLARNFASRGFTVALHNRSSAKTHDLVAAHGTEGSFVPSHDLESFVASLQRPRRIVVMVKAGAPTDATIEALVPLLDKGDIVVDAGNAHYDDTRRREAALRERGLRFVGAGVSGGEEGALLGPSIMPGGDASAYAELAPMFEAIAAKVDGVPCCVHIGPDGAGHFVKMVHNGIEYADMQLIAEAYDILRHALDAKPAELSDIFRAWNDGPLDSFLIEITAQVLAHDDVATGLPFVDVVRDEAEQKGTGRWTVQSALDLGIPISVIAEAVFARAVSGAGQRAAVRARLGGTDAAASSWPADRSELIESVRQALYAAKVVAYAQGLDLIRAASDEYGWNVDLAELATIWRGGCIIRAALLDRIRTAYTADPSLPSLLVASPFQSELAEAQTSWRSVVAASMQAGVPVPGFAAALTYYDALRAPRLPAALVQGQRDLFGAHTYRRVDREGSYHVLWAGDRSEVQVGP